MKFTASKFYWNFYFIILFKLRYLQSDKIIFNKKTFKMGMIFTDSNFEEKVIKSDKVAVVDFWAEWCGPCRIVGPFVEQLALEYDGKAVIGKLNVDENPNVSVQYGIRNIPTILFFKNGQMVDKQVGAVPKTVLEQKLKSHL